MGQRVHIGCVNRHHRIEQECQVDAPSLHRELEHLPVTIESPRPLRDRDADFSLVRPIQQALLQCTVRRPVDHLNRVGRNSVYRGHRAEDGWFKPGQYKSYGELVEL